MTILQFNSLEQHKKENAILEFGKLTSHFNNNEWVFAIYEINEAEAFFVMLASPDDKNEKIITTGYSFLDEIFIDFGMQKDQSGNWILKPQLLPSWVMKIQETSTVTKIQETSTADEDTVDINKALNIDKHERTASRLF